MRDVAPVISIAKKSASLSSARIAHYIRPFRGVARKPRAMSDFFSGIYGAKFPEVVMNSGPLPPQGGLPAPLHDTADARINYNSTLLGNIQPYAYGEPGFLSSQVSYVNQPHRIQKIVPPLRLPTPQVSRAFFAFSSPDRAYLIRRGGSEGRMSVRQEVDCALRALHARLSCLERGLGVDANPELGLGGEDHENPELGWEGDGREYQGAEQEESEESDDNPAVNIYDFLENVYHKNFDMSRNGGNLMFKISMPFCHWARDRDWTTTLKVVGAEQGSRDGLSLYKQFRAYVSKASNSNVTLHIEGYYVDKDKVKHIIDEKIFYEDLDTKLKSYFNDSRTSTDYPD